MTIEIARLQSLADDIAVELRTVMTAKASAAAPAPQAALIRAVAGIEKLAGLVGANPAIARLPSTSTLAKLEAQYGNALGRFIAAFGGLPIGASARNDSLTRLIATDPAVRAELTHIDPHDTELLEVLFEIFAVSTAAATARSRATTAVDSSEQRAAAAHASNEAERRASSDHMAQLVAERAQYVIPSILPVAAPREPAPDDDEPQQHAEAVQRVDPVDRSGKRRGR